MSTIPQTPMRKRLLTVEEYERAGELGLFGPEERLELVHGELVDKVSPQGVLHSASVRAAARFLNRVARNMEVSVQMPLRIPPYNEPEPDIMVTRGQLEDYLDQHPGPDDAVLVVEVSDTTVDADRDVKGPLYASAGVPEYWLINVRGGVLEVYRNPTQADGQWRYGSVETLTRDRDVSPLFAPESIVAVATLIPRK